MKRVDRKMLSYVLSRILARFSLKSIKNSHIDKKAKTMGKVSVINSEIGRYSYLGTGCSIVNTQIGSFCSIAGNCSCGGGAHPMDWLSTSPVFHQGRNLLGKNFSSHEFNPYNKTVIGNDVWIGAGVMVKSGVHIGNGSIIGMGSVVTKDVGDYEIWAGNPARKIRDRFDEKTKAKLLESKWWELSEEEIERLAFFSNDIEKVIEEMENFK